MSALEWPLTVLVWFGVAAALIGFVVGVGLLLNRKKAEWRLAELRQTFEETTVSDPQYNTVRALYLSALTDFERRAGASELTSSRDSDTSDAVGADAGGGDSGGGGGD